MHGNRYVHFQSSHPFTLKRAIVRGLWLWAKRLLQKHPRALALELEFLRRTFVHCSNGYPPTVIRRWFRSFEKELQRKPNILTLPVRANRIPVMDISANFMDPTQRASQLDLAPEGGQSQNIGDEEWAPQGTSATPWVPTLCTPYVPGISEWLRTLAAHFGVRSWFTYGGKLAKNFSGYKDKMPASKTRFSVYSLECECGTKYVGESGCNLKVRVEEHKKRSSNSAFRLHMWEAEGDHQFLENATTIIAQERNLRKSRFIESTVIKAKAAHLCNTGPSVFISDVWNPAIAHVAKELSALD